MKTEPSPVRRALDDERRRRVRRQCARALLVIDAGFLILLGVCTAARASPVVPLLTWIAVNTASIRGRMTRDDDEP